MSDIAIFAAIRNDEQFRKAVLSNVTVIFHLSPNIKSLKKCAESAHKFNKKLFIHLDMAEGIGKDKYGIEFAAENGIDGIISTRSNIIKIAKEQGLLTVQRFFAVDSQAVHSAIDTAKNTKPDMIEIMPGIAEKVIISISESVDIPIIAGGLVDNTTEAENAIKSGAVAVSTACAKLWAHR